MMTILGCVYDLSCPIGFVIVTYLFGYALVRLVLKMDEDRRAVYDEFSNKGAHSCSHKNLISCVELGRTLSPKVSTDAFLFKATKDN
jgi:hypothetical protein